MRWPDRRYHAGPPSDHFDGERFFNPGGEAAGTGPEPASRLAFLRFLLGRDRAPWPRAVPVVQTVPTRRIAGEAMRATWIGHSTVLVQTQGLNILTDPLWSERASPVGWIGPRRVRAPGVALAALPPIDVVLVSHSHYDHLDLATLGALWRRDRPRILLPLGCDAILRAAGIAAQAHDWGDRVTIAPGIELRYDRVRHWSSRRGADRNRALWTGFTLALPGGDLFFAGDTGMGDGAWLREVARHGPYRLALIPIGAYRPRALMAPSHIDPAEAVAIFRAIAALSAVAIHWGTFPLSDEGVDEPPRDLAAALAAHGIAADRFRALEPGAAWDVPAL